MKGIYRIRTKLGLVSIFAALSVVSTFAGITSYQEGDEIKRLSKDDIVGGVEETVMEYQDNLKSLVDRKRYDDDVAYYLEDVLRQANKAIDTKGPLFGKGVFAKIRRGATYKLKEERLKKAFYELGNTIYYTFVLDEKLLSGILQEIKALKSLMSRYFANVKKTFTHERQERAQISCSLD